MFPLLLLLHPSALAAEVALEFAGATRPVDLELVATEPAPWGPSPTLAANAMELAPIGQAVRAWSDELGLDPYGRLVMARWALDDLLPAPTDTTESKEPRSIGACRPVGNCTRQEWRLALGGLVRAAGVSSVAMDIDGQTAIGIGVVGDGLNVMGTGRKTTVRGETFERFYAAWDGTSRLGVVENATQYSSLGDTRGDRGEVVDARTVVIPEALRSEKRDVKLTFPELGEVSFTVQPQVARFLTYRPSLDFDVQFRAEQAEWAQLGLGDQIAKLTRKQSEESVVNGLLRGIQGHIRYEIGPLQSVHQLMSGDAAGDCDQLSLVLALALVDAGYAPEQLRGLDYPNHFALAVRPHKKGPGGTSWKLDGGRYVAVDPAYFHSDPNGKMISEWGDMGRELPEPEFITL